jgi:hypothetical protein
MSYRSGCHDPAVGKPQVDSTGGSFNQVMFYSTKILKQKSLYFTIDSIITLM